MDEEGLPIIEVTEPLSDAELTTASNPMVLDSLIPLSLLPPSERERQRAERDRILDLLEQEEFAQQMKDEELVQEQRREALQKREENAQREIDRLKAAREMQKKMGKALLRNMADSRKEQVKTQDQTIEQQNSVKTKSVSFAELPAGGGEPKDSRSMREKEVQLDWGDVAPGRLRSANRASLMTKAEMDKHPMKMDVVERLPTSQSGPGDFTVQDEDSDDESVASSAGWVDSDEEIHNSEDDSEYDPSLGDEEFDLDTARHHREVALTYYEKRSLIGEEAAQAMTSHTNDEEDTEWNQPVSITDPF